MNTLSTPSSNDDLVTQLNRAIFLRESQLAASTLQQLLQMNPEFSLEGKTQYDLARMLELGNEPELSLKAYESIISAEDQGDDWFSPSLKAAGHLGYRLREHKKCREYLEQFLSYGHVSPAERTDAETILNKLPDGKGVRDLDAISQQQDKPDLGLRPSESGIRMDDDDAAIPSTANDFAEPISDPDASNILMDDFRDSSSAVKPALSINEMPTSDDMNYLLEEGKAPPRLQPKASPEGQLKAQPPKRPPAEDDGQGMFNFGELPSPPPSGATQKQGGAGFSDMMFGGEDPTSKADSNYEEYSDTPPLRLDSRDLRIQKQSTTNISQENRDHKEDQLRAIRDMRQGQAAPSSDSPGGFDGMFQEQQPSDDENMAGIDPIFTNSSEEAIDKGSGNFTPPVRSKLSGAELLDHFEGHTFAVLLPVDEKISVGSVVKFLIASEQLTEEDAQRAVVERKGTLRSALSLEDVVEVYHHSVRFRQELIFVSEKAGFMNRDCLEVLKADILGPGLRLHTVNGSKKVRWEKIRFASAGRLNRQPTVDLFVNDDLAHYRLLHGTMDFLICCPRKDKSENEAARDFLKEVKKYSGNILASHTVRNLLNGRAYRPQKFSSNEEYDAYNRALLLCHFGEQIPIKQLAAAHAAVSSQW